MPPKQHETVWKAEPHTIAKIELLKAYLQAWFSILGMKRQGQDILYVDGFAGPGEYSNHPTGSPMAALDAAQSAFISHELRWKARDILCAFIDQDSARIENLRRKLKSAHIHSRVHVFTDAATFVDGLAAIKAAYPRPFAHADPLFVFIDPFGATGAPFTAVAEILQSPTSEVLINLDADGIARILDAGEHANRDGVLTEIFGDASWRTGLNSDTPFEIKCRQVLELYKRRLRSLPTIRYVFAFEMRGKNAKLNYFLVFASGHRLGLEKMKEAMRTVDQNGEYNFCDADIGQSLLFRSDDPAGWALRLFDHYKGKRALYDELHDHALNETPFVNPKAMLKWLESQGRFIANVELSAGKKRRKGTFSEDAVVAILFKEAKGHA